MAKQKIPVSERALFQRIKRKLNHDGEQLRTARTLEVESSVGHYFIVDSNNHVSDGFIDLETKGRELGVLAQWETLKP